MVSDQCKLNVDDVTAVYSCTGDYLYEVETNSPALFHYDISKREMAALEPLDVNVKYHLVKN